MAKKMYFCHVFLKKEREIFKNHRFVQETNIQCVFLNEEVISQINGTKIRYNNRNFICSQAE